MLAPAKRKGRPFNINCEPERVTNPLTVTPGDGIEVRKRGREAQPLSRTTRASSVIRLKTVHSSALTMLLPLTFMPAMPFKTIYLLLMTQKLQQALHDYSSQPILWTT